MSDLSSENPGSDLPLLGGIEAGGTKYVCAVAKDPSEPLLEKRFPTGDPESTIAEAALFFEEASAQHGPIRSLGVGTFGPADIDPRSPKFGSILTTPKPGWVGFDLIGTLRRTLGDSLPVAFDTDVNTAVLGEAEFGVGRGSRSVAYITIGTGIGGAFLDGNRVLHGRMHPEVGHMAMPDFDSDFGKNTNVCPFHGSCFEGRASGPAIEARWGMPGNEIPDHHEAWDLEAAYLAAGCVNLTATWSPDIIILGGGVSRKAGLIEKVRRRFEEQAAAYWSLPPLDNYLQTPGLDQNAGIVGALYMARDQLRR